MHRLRQDIIRAMVNMLVKLIGMTAGRIIAREGVIMWLIGGLGAYRKWKVGDPKVSMHTTESHYMLKSCPSLSEVWLF